MISSRWLWRIAGSVGLATTVLFVAGLVYTVKDVLYPAPASVAEQPGEPRREKPLDNDQLQIVALGDSLTKGTGDLSGKGYVQNVRELLEQESGKPVRLIGNYAVNGYRTDQLLRDLTTQSGIAYAVKQANIVLLTIGGNDLFAISENVLSSPNAAIDPDELRARMPEPLQRLEQILSKLAEMNPQAVIVYVGLYNPFYDLPEMRQASVYVQEWNNAAFQIINRFPNMVFVPTFDLFQLNFADYMYTDHFHPNGEGYARIARRVVQALM